MMAMFVPNEFDKELRDSTAVNGLGNHTHNLPGGVVRTGGPDHTHTFTIPTSKSAAAQASPNRWADGNLDAMLTYRMGWNIKACPFRRVLPQLVTDQKLVVFVVTKTDALIIEDDPNLYPSDTLVTQLRLLEASL